ncbi:hypothetical protein CKO21_10170 [Rhodovibrio salinarum]|uniref:Uncharacterized protein n=2 Tax=Rhodovibrio salinarum TaxID=1087 RepID=A0A934QJA3_9PROT|nr:hypothetical protein [Rhodovibrio salinarum]
MAAPALAAGEIPQRYVEKVRTWSQDPTVLITLRAWNEKHADLDQDDIDRMDQDWRKQTASDQKPLIAELLGAPLSAMLLRIQADSDGRLIETFVMDKNGLNVGQSAVTSDYWQGDEAKFQESFGRGPGAVHYGEVEVKDTGRRAQQVSLTIVDPRTGEPIGAITAEFDLDLIASTPES